MLSPLVRCLLSSDEEGDGGEPLRLVLVKLVLVVLARIVFWLELLVVLELIELFVLKGLAIFRLDGGCIKESSVCCC